VLPWRFGHYRQRLFVEIDIPVLGRFIQFSLFIFNTSERFVGFAFPFCGVVGRRGFID
jgi:hypothetical protein